MKQVLLLVLLFTNGTIIGQTPLFHDSHFHLTNYIQEGTDIHDFLKIMDDKVGRVALFGIPLQQTWAYQNSGDYAPTYYLQSDAPLYYYSFTDAHIAMVYKSLSETEKERFEPMITGFNPADMYAVDHIKRVLRTFPGVFSGIGEFTIHKEFVSSKVAGDAASLLNPALDRIFEFTAESGLISILHCDIDIPFQKENTPPVYLAQMYELTVKHPDAVIIWAHTGLGRVIHPIRGGEGNFEGQRYPDHLELLSGAIESDKLKNVYFDISWDEVAKYIVSSEESLQACAKLLNTYPDRFLFGTDAVAPADQDSYLSVYRMYEPLWKLLTKETHDKITRLNFERLFDSAAEKVRKWEASNGYR